MPLALMLDGAAVLAFVGHRLPLGLAIPEGVLLAAPLLVYGGIAFLALRTRSLGLRLGAAAVLLGLHAGLVALHTLCFVSVWSLPAPAALRLAHRWSPLIPLLQLVWVPLLASPLASLVRQPPSPVSRRSYPLPARRDILASRTLHPGHRVRPSPDRELPVAPGAPAPAPVAPAEAVTPVEPKPEELLATAPAPTWFDDLVEESAHTLALPDAESVGDVAAAADQVELPVARGPVGVRDDQPAIPVAGEPIAVVPESMGDTPEVEPPHVADVAEVMEAAVPEIPAAEAVPRATEPPLDLDLVARLFAPYGPLLSRDRAVLVDWTAGPDGAVVCVAPREMSRDHVVRLAARLARGLTGAEAPSRLGPIRRLALRRPDGVVVLTPLDGAVLVAAARRRGALALLEVLSARVVPSETDGDAVARGPDATPATDDTAVSGAIRVVTPAATLDVLAPAGVAATSMGELAGRLLAAIVADGGDPALHTLSVDLGARRLMVHPVHPDACPPRYVAVVGGRERPGLLGRLTERAARTLREAS